MSKPKPKLRKYAAINTRGGHLWVNWTLTPDIKAAKRILKEDPDVNQTIVYGPNLRYLHERLGKILQFVQKTI
jgi:hypothetical protein